MSRIRLQTLGGLRILVDGQPLDELPTQPVRCALLVYLAVQGRATRDELTALFWPERDSSRARHSLSQALYELRRQLGREWLESAGDQLAATGISIDAVDFTALAAAGRDEEALTLYGGEFLAAVHLSSGAAFEQWLSQRRLQYARDLRTVARRLCAVYHEQGAGERALHVARRWAELDPLDDEAHHELIRLLAGAGQRSAALRCYDEYARRLRDELDVEPLEDTTRLVESLRGAAVPGSAPDPGAEEKSPGVSAGTSAPLRSSTSSGSSAFSRTHGEPLAAIPHPAGPPAVRLLHAPRRRAAALLVVAVLALTLAALTAHLRVERQVGLAGGAGPSLAVLPFTTEDGNAEQAYFAEGLAEDLLMQLSGLAGVRVISRTSSWRFRGPLPPIAEIARELDVSHLLTGTVRRQDDRVRVSIELIDGRRDAQVWAGAWEVSLADVLELPGVIAPQVASALPGRPGGRHAAPGTGSVAAYDLLLRGREYLNRPGEADVRKFAPAIALFHEALAEDAAYARAYAGLSEAYRTHVALPMTVRRDSALHYARAAVAADGRHPDALTALGWALLIDRQWDAAGAALQQALSSDANHVEAMSGLARLAWATRRYEDAVRWQRRALRVDPSAPRQLSTLGSFLLDMGDLAGSEAAFRRALLLAPDAPPAAFGLAQVYLIRGQPDSADLVMAGLLAAAAGHPGAEFLYARHQAQQGRLELAGALLARTAAALPGATATVSLQRAAVARGLGQDRAAAQLLDAAEAAINDLEAEGFRAPRLRLQLAALRGDPEAALAALRSRWRDDAGGDPFSGPQLGFYWLDRDPLLSILRDDAAFRSLLQDIRREMDAARGRLALD